VRLGSPATGESIFHAIREQKMPVIKGAPVEAVPRGVLV